MPGCAVSGAPASRPVPCTTLKTPAGSPASAMMSASSDAVSGAHSGGLSDDGVPGRERRADPPGGQHQRRVPGRDDRDHAGGVVGDPLAVAADLQVRVAELLLGVVGEVPEVHRHPRHHAAPVAADQRAVVAGLDPGEVLDPGLDPVGDPAQDRRALGHRQRRPRGEGGPRRRDGAVDLLRRPRRAPGELGLVDRGDVGEGGGRGDPLARRSSAGGRRAPLRSQP